MNPLERLDQWHSAIMPQGMTEEEHKNLYRGLMVEERIEAVKELCDLVVVARPLKMDQAPMALLEMLIGKTEALNALHVVNESNFSKLVLPHEIAATRRHFENLGIDIEIRDLSGGFFGAFSSRNQTVNGKRYAKDKLLKAPSYKPVDDTKEFWR